ncbi:Dedicator of cytokinesis protein 4 [Dissostichus eleginoides]|uniref:Dedicator of cytokinesis protein 4 n=1 Tax=Dissostichus eleginoides TaxID=100907 RepID=A0AAD9F7J3_DISEL|nr:Dedicator of cytokinesis protein 4 [Dissostichus eleginoides]
MMRAGLGKRCVLIPEDADHSEIRAIFEIEFPKLESLNGDWLFYKATATTPLKLQIKAQRKAYMDKQITGMMIVWLDRQRFTQWLLMQIYSCSIAHVGVPAWKTVADPQRATEVFRRNLLGQREEMAPLRLSVDIREDVDKQEMAIISFYKSRQTKWSRPLRWTLEGDVATGDGVTRHLFSLIMKNLQHGFHINFGNSNTTLLFEGQQDHLNPSVIHVLLGGNMDTATIQLEDIADLDIRQTVGLLDGESQLSESDRQDVTALALTWDLPGVTVDNRKWLFYRMLQMTTVLDHIEWPLELSSDDEGEYSVAFKIRLQSIFATSPKQLRQLVTFWVGWDVPMKGMQMHVVKGDFPRSSTCFLTLRLPGHHESYLDFAAQLEQCIATNETGLVSSNLYLPIPHRCVKSNTVQTDE